MLALAARGVSNREIARRVGISSGSVQRVIKPLGGVVRRDMLEVSGRRLSLDERVAIAVALGQGRSLRHIAAGLGRCPS
jgi:IS30 family transposase